MNCNKCEIKELVNCCHNCAKDENKCQEWHNCGNNCHAWVSKEKPVFVCSDCARYIYEGEVYLDVPNETYCRECLVKHIKVAKKEE